MSRVLDKIETMRQIPAEDLLSRSVKDPHIIANREAVRALLEYEYFNTRTAKRFLISCRACVRVLLLAAPLENLNHTVSR